MARETRPRGIRDIAHLYLSKQVRKTPPRAVNLWIVGEEKRSLSAFHTANLAAALAVRNLQVCVFELSGLLPNVAFYFCLPPGMYLGRRAAPMKEFCPGLNGVSVVFDSAPLLTGPDSRDAVTVNIVHLPPAGDSLAALGDELIQEGGEDPWAIFLSRRAPGYGAEILRPWLDERAVLEGAVVDRVPSVVRNPNSALSRVYLGVVDSLLARVQAVRRRSMQGEGHRFATIDSAR
jgi:hypothetical protein